MGDIDQLMRDVETEVRYTRRMIGRGALKTRVMAVMREVPRQQFVPDDLTEYAYDNRPLPIGDGQTISQPYIVALMTDLMELEPEHVVLEIGTGSGYQAAVLSRLCAHVYTIEANARLSAQAVRRFEQLSYTNITARVGDGYHGWPEHAPFDAVMVTAAAPHVPPPLIEQLKPGGRLVIPVGPAHYGQELMVVNKSQDGTTQSKAILPVAFVPLTGDWSSN